MIEFNEAALMLAFHKLWLDTLFCVIHNLKIHIMASMTNILTAESEQLILNYLDCTIFVLFEQLVPVWLTFQYAFLMI